MSNKAVALEEISPKRDDSVLQSRTEAGKVPTAKSQTGDRRSQIIDIAARLFAENGYEATSMRQIANEVNILAGSLYHHFATKEDMLHAILQQRNGAMVNDIIKISQLPADAEHLLVASVIFRLRQYVEHWKFHSILLQEARFFRSHSDFAYVVETKATAFDRHEKILLDGIKAELFHPGIDTYMMIGTISRMLSSAAAWFRSGDFTSTNRRTSYSFDAMVDFNLDSILRMVRMPSRLAEPIPRQACERLLAAD